MMTALRDWWRGWSDEDLASALVKIQVQGLNPGAIIPVTAREMDAFTAYRRGYKLPYVYADQLGAIQ